MNTFYKNYILLFSILFFTNNIQANCPGCVINLSPDLSSDTIFLSGLPDGEVGIFYDQDLSFRMPKTTDPVNALDPSIPSGLNIQEITLLSIVNIPPGLDWESNQDVYDPSNETDGCMKFCGTPIIPGTYDMEFTVVAQVLGLSQVTSFTLSLIILPTTSTTEGFSMTNNTGCGEVIVDFINNIPANNSGGITYTWDFGNGNTTVSENPTAQTYSTPGVYPVSYQAIIDTVGFILTNVKVLTSGCSDFPTFPNFSTKPDMNITIFDPLDTIVFQTSNFENTDAPIEASLFLQLSEGNYRVEVVDDDSGINFNDDLCGDVTFNQFTQGILVDGEEFSLELTIIHPVDTIISVDSVTVFAEPAIPVISSSVEPMVCDGEMLSLIASYENGLQWYQDSVLLIGETDDSLTVSVSGIYYVEYVSPEGCQLSSLPFEVTTIPIPATPAYVNDNNLLTLFDEMSLPLDYTLQWFQNEELLEGENGLSYCITEFDTYTLEVVDNETGCSNQFSLTVPYNPNNDCNLTDIENVESGILNVQIGPNPTTGSFTISMENPNNEAIDFYVTDVMGRQILRPRTFVDTNVQEAIDLSHLSNGVFLIYLKVGEELRVERLVLSK